MSIINCIATQSPSSSHVVLIENHNQKFSQVKKEFKLRWSNHATCQQFPLWQPNIDDVAVIKEFDRLDELREQIWKHRDFSIELNLLGRCRRDDSIAFVYNAASKNYNASLIALNAHKFLAMEGPTEKNEQEFKNVLSQFNARHLVRLTPMTDRSAVQYNTGLKCYPYWKRCIPKWIQKTGIRQGSSSNFLAGVRDIVHRQDPKRRREICTRADVEENCFLSLLGYRLENEKIQIASKPIQYFVLEDWEDNQGVNVDKLLHLVNKVKTAQKSNDEIIACHCSAGVGRTGTFIAAYLLTEMIDKSLKQPPFEISIYELVLKLSLQRRYSVTEDQQYLTLYRLVDAYISSKS